MFNLVELFGAACRCVGTAGQRKFCSRFLTPADDVAIGLLRSEEEHYPKTEETVMEQKGNGCRTGVKITGTRRELNRPLQRKWQLSLLPPRIRQPCVAMYQDHGGHDTGNMQISLRRTITLTLM